MAKRGRQWTSSLPALARASPLVQQRVLRHPRVFMYRNQDPDAGRYQPRRGGRYGDSEEREDAPSRAEESNMYSPLISMALLLFLTCY